MPYLNEKRIDDMLDKSRSTWVDLAMAMGQKVRSGY